MSTQIIDGRKTKEAILGKVKQEISTLPFVPMFCDILVGANSVSAQYVKIKAKNAETVGIKFRTSEFPEQTTTEELIEQIENLNKVPYLCGIIVQLPLPNHIDQQKVLDAIVPNLDVDCLGTFASDDFYNNIGKISPPTALACVSILDSLNLDLSDKKILILGQGKLVGLPVVHLLQNRGWQVSVADIYTPNKIELIKNADVIISAMGDGKFIKGAMIKESAILIDAGTSEENNQIVGDVDLDSVMNIASFVSPVPGGVGPVTVAMLLQNVLQVAKNKNHE